MEEKKHIFGLLGKDISYSFSHIYFGEKFDSLQLPQYDYRLFDTDNVSDVQKITSDPNVCGLNVTVPYKEAVIPYLDGISKKAKEIGAVNTIRILKDGKLKGYNTDWFGFRKAIQPLLQSHHDSALILGKGGAAKAVAYALRQMGIKYQYVSRSKSDDVLSYQDLDAGVLSKFHIIINCTPLGTFPNIDDTPEVPFVYLTPRHLVFDLIYNPEQTTLMRKAAERGAKTSNGFNMLKYQADKSWEIWNRE